MGELLQHAPLFPGRTEISMLDMFTELLGSPQGVYKVVQTCPSKVVVFKVHISELCSQ